MMSLSDLSKEQKQYLILGVIVAAVLAVLIVMGIKVSLSSITVARDELSQLSDKIETAERFVAQNELHQEEFRTTIAELKAHLTTIPPNRNYYSWATEVLYKEARTIGFEIDAVDEIVLRTPVNKNLESSPVALESYSLRITAHGGYGDIKKFLDRIARNHPLVRVTGIEISTGSEPDVHDVQLFIQWPFNLDYVTETWGSISDLPADQPGTGEDGKMQIPAPPPARPEHSKGSNAPNGPPGSGASGSSGMTVQAGHEGACRIPA